MPNPLKNALIFAALFLTSGAFVTLIIPEGFNGNVMTEGNAQAQLLWGAVDLIVIASCVLHSRQLIPIALRQPWILAFVGWSTLSVLWSDMPILTLRRVVGLICTMALGLFLGMRLETKALLRLVGWALALSIVLSFIAGIFFPSIGIMHKVDLDGWCGVFGHKNALGGSMGLALVVFTCLYWEDGEDRWIWLSLLFPAAVLLVLSKSMTATLVTILTLCIGFYRRLPLRMPQKVALYAVALIAVLGTTLTLQGRMDSVFETMGKDSSMTGRVPLWQYSTEAVLQRPLLGAGWDGFWTAKGGDEIRTMVRWDAPHAHNSFIEMALNIGLVGLLFFLIFLYKCFRLAARYNRDRNHPVCIWPLLFFTYCFLYYFTEAPAIELHTLTFVLYCALPVSMTEALRKEAIEEDLEEDGMPLTISSDSAMVQGSQ